MTKAKRTPSRVERERCAQNRPLVPAGDRAVRADEVLSLDALQARLGIGTAALRTMRRKGLKVIRAGGRTFIAGADLIEYMSRIATAEGGDA